MESYPGCFSLQQELQHDVMLGNQDALLGALLNLLNNAIEVGAANISLTIQQGTDDNLLLVIRDDGPGMDAEEQRHVFEPFFTTKSHGTGLGLAVVDSVVKAHNGGIACRSSPGRGTVFTLILPSNNQYGLGLSAANDTQENSYEAI
jgi:two-component system sensor histidine kinase FlrB